MADKAGRNSFHAAGNPGPGFIPGLAHRHLPDPIAFGEIRSRLFSLRPHHFAAVVGFVPADGVNCVAAILLEAIAERFAVYHIDRNSFDEARRERIERVGKLAVRQAMALQRASNTGLVHVGLHPG